MSETYMQVTFCRLVGHYQRFIKEFANIVCPLYDVLGKEVKMGPVDLPLEAREAVYILKRRVQSATVLVFPDFDKPFLLEMDASKEGLGAVLSQKQSDGRYHPVTFGSCSLTLSERNYHSSKLEFLVLKWSIMEHFKEYLAYLPFVVRTNNNPLTYVLTMLNLDVTGHRWVGALASFQFKLEYQNGADNGAVDALSQVPITVTKVFYECFIAVFGVPMKLLSNRVVNFTSTLVELCAAFGIQKCRTTAYHAQCNGQVEHFHQMLFCMIGKLVHNKKAQWEQHLLELLQAYNSTPSVMTSYLLHYLMFGRCPHLPVDYYFPTVSTFECTRCVPAYVTEVRRCFKEAYAEAHLQMNCEAKRQKWYYDRATSTMQLVLGVAVLMKSDAYQGKWKVKDWWSETEYVVVHQVTDGVPAYEVKDEAGNVKTIHYNRLFLVAAPVEAIMPLGAGMSISEETLLNPPLWNIPHLGLRAICQRDTWMGLIP